jgi:hypothetical protein
MTEIVVVIVVGGLNAEHVEFSRCRPGRGRPM